jgi:rubredoxin
MHSLPSARLCNQVFNQQRLVNINQPYLIENIMSYKRYMCLLCGFIYDEEKGWPEEGIIAGTKWEDVPLAWQCPECGATKDDFEMVEIT